MRAKEGFKVYAKNRWIKLKVEGLDEFDCYVYFFRHTDTHDATHDTLFRVDVD